MDMRYTIEDYDEENYPDAWIGQAIYNTKTYYKKRRNGFL